MAIDYRKQGEKRKDCDQDDEEPLPKKVIKREPIIKEETIDQLDLPALEEPLYHGSVQSPIVKIAQNSPTQMTGELRVVSAGGASIAIPTIAISGHRRFTISPRYGPAFHIDSVESDDLQHTQLWHDLTVGTMGCHTDSGVLKQSLKRNGEAYHLANLWLFGYLLPSITFKDAVVDAIVRKLDNGHGNLVSMHKIVYPNSSERSAIRKLLVDVATWKLSAVERGRYIHSDQQFAVDLRGNVARRDQGRIDNPFLKVIGCDYHEHTEEGKTCYKDSLNALST